MTEQSGTKERSATGPPAGPPRIRRNGLDGLIAAADRLATTIAETERIAGRSAELATGSRTLVPVDAGSPAGRAERLIPLAEVARRTGRHPDLLRRWCLEGRLDATRIGRTWCLPERSLRQLDRFQRRRAR